MSVTHSHSQSHNVGYSHLDTEEPWLLPCLLEPYLGHSGYASHGDGDDNGDDE